MSENQSFGRRAVALSDPGSLIELEAREGKAELFADVDALLADVAVRCLRSEATVDLARGRYTDSVSIAGLDRRLEGVLHDLFAVANQHSRGAWFLPEKASLKVGLVNLPSIFARHPRFATGLAKEEWARVLLADSPAAVFLWAVLEPLFEQLFMPFELRGRMAGTKNREDQLAAWTSVDKIVAVLGLDIGSELAVMRYGGGWGRLRAAEQLEAKRRLLAAFAAQANEQMAARYRAHRVLALTAAYYSKAKNGPARRKQVLTRPLEKTLAGFFGGDWLRLLRYLEEAPHPDEEIASAIPETKLFVGSTKSPAAVAAQVGVPVEEVERALSTYWDTVGERAAGSMSPVDERVGVLKAFWLHFDSIHSRQTTGMRSLWGLVEEGWGVRIVWGGPDWYNPRLYRELLPSELVDEIERLWGSVMLPRWPDRVVSEISPHALMAETFGPALQFWQGSALTAWFVCEGPMSRTDMAGLATYHQDALAELERLGCPIDPALFAELREAETRLGPAEPQGEKKSSVEVSPGIRVEMSMSTGSRRAGFECLRDIITRYRREWTEQYLNAYLRARWETEIREASRLHAQAIAQKGKPPTPKQFARHAVTATSHWFGGDLSGLYAVIGERSAVHPIRVSMMPADRLGFAKSVFESLGGRRFERRVVVSSREEGRAQAEEQDRHRKLGWLAEHSVRFIQLEEALGRAPEMKEVGNSAFEYQSGILSPDPQQAWEKYAAIVEATRRSAIGAPQVRPRSDARSAAIPASPTEPAVKAQVPLESGADDQTTEQPQRRPWLRRFRRQ
jgi:hypothetical protein